jgi:polygalacturonase
VIPATTVRLGDYGALADGTTLCTGAFEKALSDLSSRGGGHLVVPSGTWLTGPIRLRDNIDLHLEKGALVQFSRDYRLYPIRNLEIKGRKSRRTTSPLSGENLENVSVTGEGTLDGGGDAWRPVKKGKLTPEAWQKLVASGGYVDPSGKIWYPDKSALKSASTPSGDQAYDLSMRPVMIEFTGCRKLLLRGIKVCNPPAWTIHPLLCTDVTVSGVTVDNADWAQNSDAIDLESCRGALIEKMWINTGDDGITIKSGKDEEGRRIGVPTEHVLVRDCTVRHAHGGFVIGSEMSGGVRDFLVTDCTFEGTQIGLRFKTAITRGGVVEGIRIRGIRMKDIRNQAICFQSNYGTKAGAQAAKSSEPAAEETPADTAAPLPVFRDFLIEEVTCEGAAQAAVMDGFPKSPIRDITLRNVSITAGEGVRISNAEKVRFENVRIVPKSGPSVIAGENVVDCRLEVTR